MRIMKLATLILALALPVAAQTFKPAAPVVKQPAPQLSSTEVLAIHQIQKEFEELNQIQQQANSDLREFTLDLQKNHPGYTFDPPSGNLVPLPKPEDPRPVNGSTVMQAPMEKK